MNSLFPSGDYFTEIIKTFSKISKVFILNQNHPQSITSRDKALVENNNLGLEALIKDEYPGKNIDSINFYSKKKILKYKDKIEEKDAQLKNKHEYSPIKT